MPMNTGRTMETDRGMNNGRRDNRDGHCNKEAAQRDDDTGVMPNNMPSEIRRGDVFYADLSPAFGSEQAFVRPVVVLQNDRGNRESPTVIIAAITLQLKHQLPTHVKLCNVGFLREGSTVLTEQLRTIDKRRLRDYRGRLDKRCLDVIDVALGVSVGLYDVNAVQNVACGAQCYADDTPCGMSAVPCANAAHGVNAVPVINVTHSTNAAYGMNAAHGISANHGVNTAHGTSATHDMNATPGKSATHGGG